MKARIIVEATVDISKGDYKALKAAGPLELVQTAQMQDAKISTSVEKVKKAKKAKDKQAETEKTEDKQAEIGNTSEGTERATADV